MKDKKEEIPLMFCFDNNYVIPAAVAFYSLLEHANQEYQYTLYVLHTDISTENQKKLEQTINKFSDFAELIFVDMDHKFNDLWKTIKTKGHFSKEVMYKVLVASIFPKYEKIIISDVDVVFLGDVSESYTSFDQNEDYYLAGVKMIGKMKWYMDQYLDRFSTEEVEKLSGFCGGYIVFNLKKLREDNMEEKFVKCFEEDGHRINQMEQDVLNLCCYPKTKRLPLKYVACSYMWDVYKTEEDKETDIWYSKEEIEDAMNHPVQLHYATSTKPWKNVDCTMSKVWFEYLAKTPFLQEYLKNLPYKIELPDARIQKIKEQITQENGGNTHNNDNTLRAKINRKFGEKRWYRFAKYVKKHPLFIFQLSFYKKVCKKITKKIDKNETTLVIFDDTFPSSRSPFRYEEYMSYFKEFNNVYVLANGVSLPDLKETRTLQQVIDEFEEEYPGYKGKIKNVKSEECDENELISWKNKVGIITFVNNLCNSIYDNIDFLEKHAIPFIFTLYPGGGFLLDDERSDKILKRACSSPYFRKVIVTQKITEEYLLKKQFCEKEKIEFIYGVVTPEVILENKVKNKKHFGIEKDTLDICFVAHKYSKQGKDKGYDLFIEMAKKLAKKYSNIKYHVVGGFTSEDIDVEEIKDKIQFHGTRPSSWFIDFYKNIDIIISPTRPFQLSKGAFDGFPTGACTEAMLNEVALICTDELKLNMFFNENEIVIVKPQVEDIVEKVEDLYLNQNKLRKIAIKGKEKVKRKYSKKEQILPRIKLIKKVAKHYYNA